MNKSEKLNKSIEVIKTNLNKIKVHDLYQNYWDFLINPSEDNINLSLDFKELYTIPSIVFPIVVYKSKKEDLYTLISGIRTFLYFKSLDINPNELLINCTKINSKLTKNDIEKYIFFDIFGNFYINNRYNNIKSKFINTLVNNFSKEHIELLKKIFHIKRKKYKLIQEIFKLSKYKIYRDYLKVKFTILEEIIIPKGCFITKFNDDILFKIFKNNKKIIFEIYKNSSKKLIENKAINIKEIRKEIKKSTKKIFILNLKNFDNEIEIKFGNFKVAYEDNKFIVDYKFKNNDKSNIFLFDYSLKSTDKKTQVPTITPYHNNLDIHRNNFIEQKVLIFERKK